MADGPVLLVLVRGADRGRLQALRLLLDQFDCRGDQLTVPLADTSPEEVLAACCAVGLEVRGSRVQALHSR